MADTRRDATNTWFQRINHLRLKREELNMRVIFDAAVTRAAGLGKTIANTARGVAQWSPANLFPTGTEEGLFLDFSDISTLYTDQTFSTNISAIGDPVGGVLDKSQGLVLGAEKLTNGGFDTDLTGWTAAAGFSVSGGKLIGATVGDKIFQDAGITAGEVCSFTITGVVGEWGVRLGQDATNDYTITADGTYFITPGALYSTTDFRLRVNIAGSELASISVKKLSGNHLIQATSTARPIWTRHPKSGVRNLVDNSGTLTAGTWTLSNATLSGGVSDPDGGSTAYTLTATGANGQIARSWNAPSSSLTYVSSWYVRRRTGTGGVYLVNPNGGGITLISVTSEWSRVQKDGLGGAPNSFCAIRCATSGDEIDVWHPQFEEGSTATTYQTRVSKYNVTEAGVADCYGLTFDGVDDYMQTAANLDLSGTDAITVCLGEYMLSGKQLTIEQGTSGASGFKFGAWDNTNNARFIRYDTTNKTSQYSSISKPTYAVITGGNVDAANQMFRWNGSVIDTGPTALGALPSDIARIGGATNPLSQGTIYGVTLTDYILDAEQLAALEEWTAARTPEVTLA